MRLRLRRHGVMAAAALSVLTAGGMMISAGTASAAAVIHVNEETGVWSQPTEFSPGVGIPVLRPGDFIGADCWTRGESLGHGNVWYHTHFEHYNSMEGLELAVSGWTYGGFVDGNAAFHQGLIPEC